jgi:hypothetical protein
MSRLNYVSETAKNVSASYADMPASAGLAFVNTTSEAKTRSQSNALSKGGDGSADIPIDPTLAAGWRAGWTGFWVTAGASARAEHGLLARVCA